MLERVEATASRPARVGRISMAITAICVSCERSVFLEENQTGSCPVCASPVIPTVTEPSVAALEGYYLG
jgi:uncharacterized CHY-type Zn-finger protein